VVVVAVFSMTGTGSGTKASSMSFSTLVLALLFLGFDYFLDFLGGIFEFKFKLLKNIPPISIYINFLKE
jgi:hypothetical protein